MNFNIEIKSRNYDVLKFTKVLEDNYRIYKNLILFNSAHCWSNDIKRNSNTFWKLQFIL